MQTRLPLRRSAGRAVFWIPLGFVLASGAVLAVILLLLRNEAIHAGERLTPAFARLTAEQTTRTLQSVDQTLQLARLRLAGQGGSMTARSAEILASLFRADLVNRPFLRALFVLDDAGRVVIDTSGSSLGADMSDRAYFQHFQQHPKDAFEVTAPVVSRATGLHIIPAARPWLRADGSFAGIVAAVIDPAKIADTWAMDDAESQSFISLLRREGTMLTRNPFDEKIVGLSVADAPVFQILPSQPNGTLQTVSPIDGLARVLSYRTLDAYPNLVISLSMTRQHVLADWRRHAQIAAASWVLGSLVLTILTLGLRREWQRRSAVEEELGVSWDRLSAVMDHTVDGLVVIDQKGKVLSFSKPAERIFGYAADEVVGRNVKMLMPESYRAAHDSGFSAYLKTGQAQIIGRGREVEGRRKDGSFFPMDVAVGEIPSVGGIRQFVGTIRDISGRKATEEQLRQAQKMEAVGQLTGGIAHDFNNLLAVMLGNVEMIREMALPAKAVPLMAAAERAAQRGAELTRRLLAFSRRQTLLPQRVDINRLVLDMVTMLHRTLGETIRVETRLDADPRHALVDAGQLENALINLAVNARDAMPHGGVLSIATGGVVLDDDFAGSHEEVTPGAYRMIAVSDNGTGMTAEVKARAFEPFFTTKDVGKGSGLGLSMVYGFVKQSGGHVSIYSEPGRGSTVRLYLPIADEDKAMQGLFPAADDDAAGQGQTILVVEDDNDVRTLLATMVTRLGYRPVLAADGHQALATLANGTHIDLMITDVVMPGMSGVELAAVARRRRPEMPVIFISGYSDESEALAEVVQSGGTLLAKPFSRTQLAQVIQSAMSAHHPGAA